MNVRDVDQQFWSNDRAPHLTIRSTTDCRLGYKAHSHPQLSIGIIESGATCLSIEGRDIRLNKGDLILIPPNVVHACNPIAGQSRSYYMLYIEDSWCREVIPRVNQSTVGRSNIKPVCINASQLTNEFSGLIKCLIQGKTNENLTEINELLLTILKRKYDTSTINNPIDRLAVEIKIKLIDNIAKPVKIEDIAKEFSCTSESIIRRFKAYFGSTPKSFLNNYRIERAKKLLDHNMAIVDVAIEVGYSDQSQFHRHFVNYTASTPRQYQQAKSILDNK